MPHIWVGGNLDRWQQYSTATEQTITASESLGGRGSFYPLLSGYALVDFTFLPVSCITYIIPCLPLPVLRPLEDSDELHLGVNPNILGTLTSFFPLSLSTYK